MFLKNYTSEVPVSVTISRIQKSLLRAGVKSIEMDYGPSEEVTAITFKIQVDEGRSLPVRMPADVEMVQEALWLDYIGDNLMPDGKVKHGCLKKLRRPDFRAQAQRTAWKLVQEWIEIQISMIQVRRSDPLQVFLSYIWDGKHTFYQRLKESKFKALMPAPADRVEVVD